MNLSPALILENHYNSYFSRSDLKMFVHITHTCTHTHIDISTIRPWSFTLHSYYAITQITQRLFSILQIINEQICMGSQSVLRPKRGREREGLGNDGPVHFLYAAWGRGSMENCGPSRWSISPSFIDKRFRKLWLYTGI